jgi:DNA-binding LacI/PurR family transcriptional regulator
MAGRVTIATVAHHAQVSRQTVSNVINAPHLVRQETRERVRDAIEALGYRASQAARQMRTGRSRLIAVRIGPAGDGINGSILDRFLHGLTEAAAPAGYRIVLYTATDDAAEIATYDELLGAHHLDGFVLTGTHHGDARTGWLAERGVAFVTFGRPWGARPEPDGDAPEPHPWIDVDGARGTRDATRRLLAAGHRRVGFIGWPAGSGVGDDRREGWLAALRAAGTDPAGLERRIDDGVAEGERATADLLATSAPTALVCASDSLALGAMRATQAGQNSPHDPGTRVAVIGFDDTPVARAVGLTSVGQPLAEAAAGCIALLTGLLDRGGDSGHHEHVLLRPRVVVRDSG